jgi:hypothetical protein
LALGLRNQLSSCHLGCAVFGLGCCCLVEVARLIFLFRVGLAPLFVGVALSESPVGLSQFIV